MKRIIIIAIAVMAAVVSGTGCTGQVKSDVSVHVSAQLEDWSGDIAEGLAYMEEGNQIKAIFGKALETEGFEPTVQDYYVLRDQKNITKAKEMVNAACDKAKVETADFSPKKRIVIQVGIESVLGSSNNTVVFESLSIDMN